MATELECGTFGGRIAPKFREKAFSMDVADGKVGPANLWATLQTVYIGKCFRDWFYAREKSATGLLSDFTRRFFRFLNF